jgi:hypothetical protein
MPIQFYLRKVLPLKRSAFLLLFLFLLPLFSICQTDSLPKHGTIKIGKAKDTIYIKAELLFYKYTVDNEKENVKNVTYSDFVNTNKPVINGRISAPYPTTNNQKDSNFDYTAYFYSNPITQKVDLLEHESDTVNLLIFVDKKGNVKHLDLTPMQKIGNTIAVYDSKSKNYVVDLVHYKVNNAMKQLTQKKWKPALLHKTVRGKFKKATLIKPLDEKLNSTGILTIIFSTTPIE